MRYKDYEGKKVQLVVTGEVKRWRMLVWMRMVEALDSGDLAPRVVPWRATYKGTLHVHVYSEPPNNHSNSM